MSRVSRKVGNEWAIRQPEWVGRFFDRSFSRNPVEPDRSKAHDLGCPALSDGECECAQPTPEDEQEK